LIDPVDFYQTVGDNYAVDYRALVDPEVRGTDWYPKLCYEEGA
jgi:hypothetical protein